MIMIMSEIVDVTSGVLSSVAVLESNDHTLRLQQRPLPGESPSQSHN